MCDSKYETKEQALEAVREEGSELEHVPEEFKTAELCMEAVKNKRDPLGFVLKYVPEHIKTAELCMEAVKKEGTELEDVPEEFKTLELCTEAIKNNGYALEDVPEEFKTLELCMEAIKQNPLVIKIIPEEFKTYELCLKVVKKKGWALSQVPKKFKTTELCLEAVKKSGSAFKYVPEHIKTAEFYLEAVKGEARAIQFVPEEFKTEELCIEAVKKHYRLLEFVPDALKEQVKNAVPPPYNQANNLFSHTIIRDNLQSDKEEFIKALEEYQKNKTKDNFLSLFSLSWRSACEKVGIEEKTAIEEAGIEIDFNELSEEVLLVVVKMPEPKEVLETKYIAFVYSPNAQEKIRYFAYELSLESQFFVCEWDGKRHRNFGNFEEPNLECFLGRVKNIIKRDYRGIDIVAGVDLG